MVIETGINRFFHIRFSAKSCQCHQKGMVAVGIPSSPPSDLVTIDVWQSNIDQCDIGLQLRDRFQTRLAVSFVVDDMSVECQQSFQHLTAVVNVFDQYDRS